MLIIIGFVCLLHLPTSELRRPAHISFWREVARMNSTHEFYRKYVAGNRGQGTFEDMLIRVINNHRISNEIQILQGYEDTIQGSTQQEVPDTLLQVGELTPCKPVNTFVPLPDDSDPRYERLPSCAFLPRCGGCCGPILTCAPTSVISVPVTVFRGIPSPDPDAKFLPVTLTMESHVQCGCLCTTKESDCNPITQDYDSNECSCRCRNADQATNCPPQKRWDEKLCRCICRNSSNCLDDELFNIATCSCQSK